MKNDLLNNEFIVYFFDLNQHLYYKYIDIFKNKNFEDIDINDFASKNLDKEYSFSSINEIIIDIVKDFEKLKIEIKRKNINNLPIRFNICNELF